MARKKEFLLRIDGEVWEELQRWASDELRSVNGQIEYLLRNALVQRRRQGTDPGVNEGDSPKDGPGIRGD